MEGGKRGKKGRKGGEKRRLVDIVSTSADGDISHIINLLLFFETRHGEESRPGRNAARRFVLNFNHFIRAGVEGVEGS